MLSERTSSFELRPPNWLPLPGEEDSARRREAVVDANDLFAKGEVAAFYPKQRRGLVRDEHGRLLPFALSEIVVLGDAGELDVQRTVGFDASHTSHGLRITRIKVY